MHKLNISILILLSTLLLACKSESAMIIEQPNYYVKLNMQSCTRIVAVNGFEVESDFDGHSSAAEIPINHLIKNGDNYFELMVPDQEGVKEEWTANTSCVVEVRVSGTVKANTVDYKVADIVFSADYSAPSSNLYKNSMQAGSYSFNEGKTVLSENSTDSVITDIIALPAYEEGMDGVFKRGFIANVPFPKWAFFDADKLFGGYHPLKDKEQYRSAKKIIWPKVEELWDLFESKKIEKILPLFEFRSKEYDQAFYREPGNTIAQLSNSLKNVYESNYPINRKDNKNMQMLVSYANNLVTIVNAATYNGTVMFYDYKSDSNTFYTVYWMQKDGKWIIAR